MQLSSKDSLVLELLSLQIERFHSTIIEHLRLLNSQGFEKNPVDKKMTYAIMAYNHSLHTVTKIKPIDIVNGHITDNDPFNIDIDKILLNDYVNDHKERSELLYSKINEALVENKTRVVERENKKRDKPIIFKKNQKVYIKKHIRNKNANKYSKSTKLKTVNRARKTVSTEDENKIHMNN